MRYSTAVLLGLVAVQQAAACDICEWGQALGLPSCGNSCNSCTQQQQQGLDFSQCPAGSSSFGGLNFGGCSIGSWLGLKKRQSFAPRGKRSLSELEVSFDKESEIYKRTDQCALGALTSGGGPSFSCGAGTNAFSISNMLVSCDQDTPVQLTYSYDSGPQAGQTCQQNAQLSAGAPQTITNTQCGGASSVQCALAPNAPVPSCNLGIHSVNFDCSDCPGGSPSPAAPTQPAPAPPPAAATTPPAPAPPPPAPAPPAPAPPAPAPPAPAPPAPAPPAPAPPAPAPPAPAPPAPPAAPSVPAPAPPPPAVTPPVVPPPAVSTGSTFSPSTSYSTSVSVSISTGASMSMPTYPANSSLVVIQTTVPQITTEIVYTTVTSCNGLSTITQGNYTSIQTVPTLSTLLVTSTQTVCTKCTASPSSVTPASTISTTISVSNTVQSVVVTQSVSTSVSVSVQAAPAPSLLPSCLQTWIKLTGCKDNSDSNCFCNDANFTKNVQECVSAWSNHKDQEAQALSYLAGICANHIGSNPGIITNIPSTITLQPTPAATATPSNGAPAAPGGQTVGAAQPVTTISLSTTVTVQCSAGSGQSSMAGGCSSVSVLSTQVAVPQVAFTTAQPGKVGLVAGTPAPAQAVATPAPAAPVNSAPNSPAVPASVPPPAAAPAGTGGITPYYSPSASVQAFTGAAANLGGSSMFVSIVVAVAGLFVL